MDCGTHYKAGVDAVGAVMRQKLEALGLAVEEHDVGALGNSLAAAAPGCC